MLLRAQQENKDSIHDKQCMWKTRGIKFHQTLRITDNTDLATPRVRDLLQAIVEVTHSQGER
jgi:hypothetical protein